MIKKNKTKIVATLGPVSRDEKTIEELVLAGATMFRINTSHNTPAEHAEAIKKIRAVEQKLKTYIPYEFRDQAHQQNSSKWNTETYKKCCTP